MSARNLTALPARRARFHSLTVAELRMLTPDSVEVCFVVPPTLQNDFTFLPGQYLALRAIVDGRELRRSYSLCRASSPGRLSIAVKRDVGGAFSTWVTTALRVGDHIDVMSPQGRFRSALLGHDNVHIAGIAAGSGITPLLALVTAVLAESTTSRFSLVYSNRSAHDVMFLDELAEIKDRHPGRLALYHVLTREQRSSELLSGRLDADKLNRLLERALPPGTVDEWFLCGPFGLVQMCQQTLLRRGVDAARVRCELFTTGVAAPPDRPRLASPGEAWVTIEFTLDGQSSTVTSPVSARESILSAALRVRADVPYACAGGVCGTCRATLVSGAVAQNVSYALEPDEIARGQILTCQSHPTTDRVSVSYDA